MEQIKIIIRQYIPKAVILCFDEVDPQEIIKGKIYTISNFPKTIHQCVIDFIDCHYSVEDQDYHSITFKSI